MQSYQLFKRIVYALSLMLMLASGSMLAARPTTTAASSGPQLILLTAGDTPALRALSDRYPTTRAELSADDATIHAALGSAIAVAADLATLDSATIRRSRWFQLAQAQDVPIVLAHATPDQMAAVTGLGYGGDLVLLRSSAGGQRVGVYVLLATGAEATQQHAQASSGIQAIAGRIQALLSGDTRAQAAPPVPQPDTLPVRAARVWDVEAESPRLYLANPYTFPIPGTSQSFLDDVRFSVGLYSTGGPEQPKYLAIATSGGGGVSAVVDGSSMAANSDTDRGFYLESYDVTIGPSDANQTQLQIENRAPQTVNRDGSFSSSTGFTLGATAAAEGALSAEYSQQNSASVNLQDFTVKAFGTATQARWSYALSSVGGGHPYSSPQDLIIQQLGLRTPHLYGLPGLASGQLLAPANQVVYKLKGTPNSQGGNDAFQGTIIFKVAHQAIFRRVQIVQDPFGSVSGQVTTYPGPAESAQFPVDFSMVNYRGDLRLDRDDIAIQPDASLGAGSVYLTALVHSDLADYDGVGVSFYSNASSPRQLIGSTKINIATLDGPGQRSGQALARVPWNIGSLLGTQNISVQVDSQDGERNLNNNIVTRDLNITAPRLLISKSSFDLAEGGPADSYQVTLSTRPTSDVIVGFATDGATQVAPQGLVFNSSNWNSAQPVAISAVDDDIVEGTRNSSIVTTLSTSDPDYMAVRGAPIIATVADNDNASPSALKMFRGGARASYQFVLSHKPSATVAISITADSQLALTPSSLTFAPADWDTPQTVVVRTIASSVTGDSTGVIHHRASSSDASYSGVQLAAVQVAIRDPNNPATTINVTSSADELGNNGQCSLREAILAANTNATVYDCVTGPASYHVINLNAAGPYDLSVAPEPNFPTISHLDVSSEIILNGKRQTIRNRNATGISRHFFVHDAGNLTLNDITLRDGAGLNAGAIFVNTGATVNLVRSTITHNAAVYDTSGGALVNSGTLNIIDSAITDNQTTNTNMINQNGGGAITNQGTLNIANSTISGNRSTMGGGGIENYQGLARLTNVTITGNTADSDNDGVGDGGGLVAGNAVTIIKNSIIAGNFDTPGNAGANATTPDLARRPNLPEHFSFFSGPIFSAGNNLIGNVGTFNFANNAAGDRFGDPLGTSTPNLGAAREASVIDAQLGGLSGDPALHALQTGSPAVDSIAANECSYQSGGVNPLFIQGAPVDHDQRADARPHGFRCDGGAYELAQPGIDISVTALDVPTGQFGSVYAIVLKTRPTSTVTIDLTTGSTTTASPSQLVFTPDNWSVPQRVTVIARRPLALAGARLAAVPTTGVIHHQVLSADPAYSAASIPDMHATVVVIGTPSYSVYLPMVAR